VQPSTEQDEEHMNHYYQLTREQRYQISALKGTGLNQKEIANALGVAPSTISRELGRNSTSGRYDPQAADTQSRKRRSAAAKASRITDPMWDRVEALLCQEWSPEQVSGRLKEGEGICISHESIYRRVRQDKADGGELYTYLRQGFKRRRKYGKRDLRGHIRGRVSIDHRPAVVDERSRLGDWELDTIHGTRRNGMVTAVERKAGLTRLGKVSRRGAEEVRSATIGRFKAEQDVVLTLTSDNGKEFADHEQISRELDADFYFAHPYSSWERGTNENTNGLVRQYFPKGTDFDEIEPWEIQWVEDRINNRPRKRLDWATPNEVYYGKDWKKEST
jgi:IS30 family transposase